MACVRQPKYRTRDSRRTWFNRARSTLASIPRKKPGNLPTDPLPPEPPEPKDVPAPSPTDVPAPSPFDDPVPEPTDVPPPEPTPPL
ncbi:hypothetical protein [Bythopirellula goksoeyrii]|uniref:Uncharacterized protein n=1 Tax=Bythopirellula goksoeyrii TaxID=1400387 RepID=A0A5B9QH94_9BACT|nr:hypothetical protein [Bythopirellula goksoeyrii]QEG36940.1 hypothetical protein Pr1d_42800 [Bythopirellula goksoeyrii]